MWIPYVASFQYLAIGFGFYIIAHASRSPFTFLARWLGLGDKTTTVVTVVLPVVAQECLRLVGFVLLVPIAREPSSPPLHFDVWSYAVGFALGSEAYGIADVFRHLNLYVDGGMRLNDSFDSDSEGHSHSFNANSPDPESQTPIIDGSSPSPDDSTGYHALDRELDRLITVREREQLERILGLAFSVSALRTL